MGCNAWVKIGIDLKAEWDESRAEEICTRVLARVDHQNLAKGRGSQVPRQASGLCQWIYNELLASGLEHVREVRLDREFGVSFIYRTHGSAAEPPVRVRG